MALKVNPKAAISPEEANLAIHTAIVTLAQTVRGLLDDEKRLEELGKQAVKSNALNEAEIAARDEAVELVEQANAIVKAQAEREESIQALGKQLEQKHADSLAEVEAQHEKNKAELHSFRSELDGRHSTLSAAEATHAEKVAEFAARESHADKRHAELDERERNLNARQAEIDRLKSLLAG